MAAEQAASDGALLENGVAHEAGNPAATETKNKLDKRKEKKKRQKQNKQQRRQQQQQEQPGAASSDQQEDADEQVVIEYVTAPPELDFLQPEDPQQEEEDEEAAYGGLGLGLGAAGLGLGATPKPAPPTSEAVEDFKRILEKFTLNLDEAGTTGEGEEEDEEGGGGREGAAGGSGRQAGSDAESDEEGGEGGKGDGQLSRKQRKLLQRMKIAELKQQCARPDVVEVWDVTAPDPATLVTLKAYRNTVAVPRHWSQKRKYLQGKRGIEKPPFQLPDFIEATGISAMRQAYQEKEEAKKLKQKARDRMQPKIGKLDIDYAVLHDAFFKHQRPPKFSGMGDIYYEGKEYEAAIADLHPGRLSAELREALGMSEGAPPPWLINMQRYGPPPSYPNLKISGLNAPIPPGASFGYHPGGWGKPPVDESGQPLYGDVFGVWGAGDDSDEELDKGARWGVLEPELEESSEEEEEEEEGSEQPPEPPPEEALAGGIATDLTGLASSLPSGLETPDTALNLRKGESIAGTESAQAPQLFTVLETRKAEIGRGTLLGSEHVYVLPDQEGRKGKRPHLPGAGPVDVELTLAPEELEGLDEAAIRALYEEKVAAAKAAVEREDFSDMVAAHNASAKRKAAARTDARAAKKQKEFKF